MTAASGRRFLTHRSTSEDCNDMSALADRAADSTSFEVTCEGTCFRLRQSSGRGVGRASQALVATLGLTMSALLMGSDVGYGQDGAKPFHSVVVSENGIEPEGGAADGLVHEQEWSDSANAFAEGQPSVPMASGASFDPRWDLAVDALMLWQGNAQSLPLFLDTTTGGTAFNAQDMQTQMGAGVRVGLLRYVGDCHAIEGNYFQARPFNATGSAPVGGGPYELANMGNLVFNDIESATVASSGWIQSAELNWRKGVCYSPISWIAGFRWVELNSQTNVDYQFTNPDPFGSGAVNTAAGNNLYGGQVGADMRLWNGGGKWRLNGLGKAGIFYNAASFQRSTAGFTFADGTPYPLGTVAATADQTSFFGEIGLNSTYWITNWLAWRAGYTVMWASGVAVATEQLPLNSFGPPGTATINTNGSVLLHGVTTGIEARW